MFRQQTRLLWSGAAARPSPPPYAAALSDSKHAYLRGRVWRRQLFKGGGPAFCYTVRQVVVRVIWLIRYTPKDRCPDSAWTDTTQSHTDFGSEFNSLNSFIINTCHSMVCTATDALFVTEQLLLLFSLRISIDTGPWLPIIVQIISFNIFPT